MAGMQTLPTELEPVARRLAMIELQRRGLPVRSEHSRFERYRNDPVGFVRDVLGETLWSKQREILEGLRDHSQVTVRSCHGIGKTFTAARACLWFLLTRPNSIVLSTAPTWRQVEELLWREIRGTHGRSKLPGKCLTTQYELGPQWYALGLSTNEPDRFQGFHAEDVLLVCDEASGIPPSIFEAAYGVLTTAGSKQLLLGNPTGSVGLFYDSHHGRAAGNWHRIKVSAFDTPAYTGEDVPEATLKRLTSREWVTARAEEWGEQSAAYKARVLGEFAREEGLVYPEFDPNVHLREPWMPQRTNRHFVSIDVGWRNPTAILFAEVDREGMIGIWGESYRQHTPPAEHLRVIDAMLRGHGLDPAQVTFLVDPSAYNHTPDGREGPGVEWERQAKILGFDRWFRPSKATNAVVEGVQTVKWYLRTVDGMGQPREPWIYFASTCKWLLWEMDHYAWPKVRGPVAQEEKPEPENPVKKDDHACDALRYLVAELPKPMPAKPLVEPFTWERQAQMTLEAARKQAKRQASSLGREV